LLFELEKSVIIIFQPNGNNMIIITGKNGFIARHLIQALEPLHQVVGLSKEDSQHIQQKLVEYQPEYIYHTGAELSDNDKMFESNLVLTHSILEYCRHAPQLKRLILIGSSSEYGRKELPMKESDVLEPRTIYEGTKAAASMLAQSYSHTYGIPILIIRPFTIYGPHEKPNKFLQILFRKKKEADKTISISEGVHDYVYIDDFINGLIEIVARHRKLFDIINIGSGIQTTNQEVVSIFERITNYRFDHYIPLAKKTYDSDCWVSDTTKLNQFYQTRINLEEGIKRMDDIYSAV